MGGAGAARIVRAVTPVIDALDRLGVVYHIGGSVASSAFGVPRSTLDVDLVTALRVEHVRPFIAALGNRYYADEGAALDAVRRHASFNVIHHETMIK